MFLNKRKIQSDENNLPYHYSDLISEESRLVWEIERLVLMETLKKLLGPFKGQYILDAGCGDGRFCYELRGEKAQIEGLDVSDRAIAFAKVFNPGAKFRVSDLEKVIAGTPQYDQIVCQEMLEHIPISKVDMVLSNLKAMLKPSGTIIFTVPTKKLQVPMKHFQHFDKDSLESLLSRHFVVKEILGHNVVSYKRPPFILGKYIAHIAFPFKQKTGHVFELCRLLRRYYEDNLAVGKPEEGLGLIAICKKHT